MPVPDNLALKAWLRVTGKRLAPDTLVPLGILVLLYNEAHGRGGSGGAGGLHPVVAAADGAAISELVPYSLLSAVPARSGSST